MEKVYALCVKDKKLLITKKAKQEKYCFPDADNYEELSKILKREFAFTPYIIKTFNDFISYNDEKFIKARPYVLIEYPEFEYKPIFTKEKELYMIEECIDFNKAKELYKKHQISENLLILFYKLKKEDVIL